mmetsp:Transcript_16891/g.42967  ORF Transcript_16891/g.42967 Transcript_16891/m.42967 type:complete len:272 (-) Transcript_16891:321-1136(-)
MLTMGEVSFQPGGQQSSRKTQDWSPINRMLAAKRGSSRTPTSKAQLMQQCPTNLPRPALTPPPATPKMDAACTQTVSWEVLKAEVVAHERGRADVLERDIKELKAQLKQGSAAAKAAFAKEAAEAAERIRTLELEAEALKEGKAQAVANLEEALASLEEERRLRREERLRLEEERQKWQEEQRSWGSEREQLHAEVARAAWLSQEVDRRSNDLRSERETHRATREELQAMTQERDRLLERLEVEQAEMMARVAKLEERGSRKNSLGARSSA